MVSAHLKNISQIESFPQVGVKVENIWNHHLDIVAAGIPLESTCISWHDRAMAACEWLMPWRRPEKLIRDTTVPCMQQILRRQQQKHQQQQQRQQQQ